MRQIPAPRVALFAIAAAALAGAAWFGLMPTPPAPLAASSAAAGLSAAPPSAAPAALQLASAAQDAPGAGADLPQRASTLPADPAMDMALGDPGAPITLIEYASFTCPHCANFHANVLPQLKANYVETGKVRYIHREVYFDRYGLWAGLLARCGGEERYFGIADMIYAQQRSWAASNDPAVVADNLRRMGRIAGLSDDEVNACLGDREAAQALVAAYQTNAAADGVQATPTLVINGTRHPNMPYAELARLLDAKLAN